MGNFKFGRITAPGPIDVRCGFDLSIMMVHHLEDLECVLHLPQLRQTSVGKTQKIVNHGKYQIDLVGVIYVLVLVSRFNSV